MQEGHIDNPFVDIQEESTSLELEIEDTRKDNNVENGVVNPMIFEEEKVVEATMEVQAESLKVTTTILEKIDIPIERTE
jgi:cytochrome c-type biogenesis protein CcmE